MTLRAEVLNERAPLWLVVEEVLGFSGGKYAWSGARWFHHDHFTAFQDDQPDALPDLLTAALGALPHHFDGRHEPRGYWSAMLRVEATDADSAITFLLSLRERMPLINKPEELL